MNAMDNAAGASWQKWLLGLVAGALIAGGGGLVHAVTELGQRVSATEARHEDITRALRRIEDRLDRLLDKHR